MKCSQFSKCWEMALQEPKYVEHMVMALMVALIIFQGVTLVRFQAMMVHHGLSLGFHG